MGKSQYWKVALSAIGCVFIWSTCMGSSCYKQPDLICQPDPLILGVSCYDQDGHHSGGGATQADTATGSILIGGQDLANGGVFVFDPNSDSLIFDLTRIQPLPRQVIFRFDADTIFNRTIGGLADLIFLWRPPGPGTLVIELIFPDGSRRVIVITIRFPGSPNPNPTPGTCCRPDGLCLGNVGETACVAMGGVWAAGGACGNFPCAPLGSCYTGNSCKMTTQAGCGTGSTWTAGGNCNAPPTGSCTLPDGQCEISTQANCNGQHLGAVWTQGGNCPVERTCCVGGACSLANVAYCASQGGTYLGGVACTGDTCNPPDPTGACCVNGACSVTTQAGCAGTWTANANCNGFVCSVPPPPSGTCCMLNGDCAITTSAGCAGVGTWTQGANCLQNPCPVIAFNVQVLSPANLSTYRVGDMVTATVKVTGGVGPFKYHIRWPDQFDSPIVTITERQYSASHAFQFPISPQDDDGYGVIIYHITDMGTGDSREGQRLIEVLP